MTDQEFIGLVLNEVKQARRKFPDNDALNCALVEEVGELSKALMYEPFGCVVDEAVQVAAMACRIAIEGDPTMTSFRYNKVHNKGTRYMRVEHIQPCDTELIKWAVNYDYLLKR